jgi:GNAT superfamily N-acetyltransferase
MDVSIRYFEAGDFDQVFGLLKQLWSYKELDYEGMKKMLDHNLVAEDHFYIVAADGAQVVGFCSLSVKRNLWLQDFLGNVDEMVVDENYRGQGIGKKLMQRITEIAIENNCKQLELESSFHREKAHAFYEELGFEKRAFLFSKPL